MKIKTGCDIVHIPRFKELVLRNSDLFLQKIFSCSEINATDSLETLAGWLSVKESVLKALALKPGSWLEIEIFKHVSGKPDLRLNVDLKIISYDISISHEKDYAISTCCFLIE